MTLLDNMRRLFHKLFVSGVLLRCPNCEKGRMFHHLFRIDDVCEVCGVRFERLDGESIGGMAITMGVIPPISIAGFFMVNWLTNIGFVANGIFWVLFIIMGCTLIYRHSRAAWVAVSWITGGVYADETQLDTTEARQKLVEAARSVKQADHY
ncbi:MAG: DUF983 domain-containing protein [Chloroflexota bacterium]